MNIGAPWPTPAEAEVRVLRMQKKLHQWAISDRDRRFDDLFNLVYDPAVLVVAWRRVRGNKGKRSGGVDRVAPVDITDVAGLIAALRDDLKAQEFVPLPARERMIPKAGGKLRRLGIATVRDRVAQAALKLVLEPIFEAEFHPCSYGFRPRRRAQDAIAEIHQFTSRSYEWVLEGDIEACFDNIDHTALMDRVRRRVGDKRVLNLVKAFLKAGILGEDGFLRNTSTGTPQGGIVSPLLANIALSVLDDYFADAWQTMSGTTYQRWKRRRLGFPNYRLVRYADDFVVVVHGTRDDAEAAPGRRRTALGADGPTPVRGQDQGQPHRRGPRFSGLPHPAEASERHDQACGLYLPVEEGPRGHHRSGPHADPTDSSSVARRPAAPAQSGAAGLVHLLQTRRIEGDLRLPRRVRVASSATGGSADDTRRRSGPSCSAGSSRTGDPPRMESCCSSRRRSRSAVTATVLRTSRHRGRRPSA